MNFRLKFDAVLRANDKGQIEPKVSNIKLNFDRTFLAHDNWFSEIIMWTFVEYSKRFVENTVLFFGNAIGDLLY